MLGNRWAIKIIYIATNVFLLSQTCAFSQNNINQNSMGGCSPNIYAGGNVNVYCSNSDSKPNNAPNAGFGTWCLTSAGYAGPGSLNPIGSPCSGDGLPGTVVQPPMGFYCLTELGRGNPGAARPVGTNCFSNGPYGTLQGVIVQ